MWVVDVLRLMVDVVFICLMILILWSFAFGHNRQYISSANRLIRYALNANNRHEFVVIFDADPDVEDEVSKRETQTRVELKLQLLSSLILGYEDKIRNFEPDLTSSFSDYDIKMQLENLIQSVAAHKRVFWNAHEVAKSCGFVIRASIYDYTNAATDGTPTLMQGNDRVVRFRDKE